MLLTAPEAASRLGISVRSLYAYVSRGHIRSEPISGSRARGYHESDVESFRQRQLLAKRPEQAMAGALDWGVPLLTSSITQIDGGRLYYRGLDATMLAGSAFLEDVAALIWTGDLTRGSDLFCSPNRPPPAEMPDLRLFERLQVLMPMAAAADAAAWDVRPASMAATGARILQSMTAMIAQDGEGHLASQLASSWRADPELISAALILCADHELNVSAFTARCVASAGSTLYDVVGAGLAALRGARHGGHTERAETLLAEAARVGGERAISDRLRRGESVPGFGQPLYPDGDPRARYLLDRLSGPEANLAREVAEAGRSLLGEHPTIDLGLAALGRAQHLPEGAPLALFALGRSVGWIGHAIEQVADGRLIRPRARYDGPPPRVVPRPLPG